VRAGSKRDALLFAVGSDLTAGLRRTTADKRRAIALVLGNFPKLSDRKIAAACGTDHKTVAAARRALEAPIGEIPQGVPGVEAQATVERLSRALAKLLAQWPADRRSALQTLIDSTVGAPRT